MTLITYGLPDDYYGLHPSDHLTIAVVGDRKAIEPSIRALNFGSIKDVSVDEVFAPAR